VKRSDPFAPYQFWYGTAQKSITDTSFFAVGWISCSKGNLKPAMHGKDAVGITKALTDAQSPKKE